MANEIDPAIIEQLNAQRQKQINNMNVQEKLNRMRQNQIETGSPEEQLGFGGVLSDMKNIARHIPSALGHAALEAPHAIYEAGKQAFSLPIEIPKFLYKTATEGYHKENLPGVTKNLIKGFMEASQLPGETASYLGKKEIIPKSVGENITPHYPELGFKEGEENPILKAMAFLGGPVLKGAEELALTKNIAARPLRQARKEAQKRNIENLAIPEDIFQESSQYLPNSLPNRNLIETAQQGGYDPLFTLQSDIGKAGASLRRSLSGAERLHGKEAEKLRQRLLESMREELKKHGHEDIAHLMERGQKLYRRNKQYTKPALAIALALGLGANPVKHGINYALEKL